MTDKNGKSAETQKGFWAGLMEKLDRILKEKSQKSGACCGGKSKGGSSCC